jgi:hypothetical protein
LGEPRERRVRYLGLCANTFENDRTRRKVRNELVFAKIFDRMVHLQNG